VVYGDLDDSGIIDVTDLSMLSLYLIGDMSLDERQLKAADVTAAGKPDITSLARLRQYLSNPGKIKLGPA